MRDILQIDDLPREAVAVPEWHRTVTVRAMSGVERGKWAELAFDDDGSVISDNMRARLLVFTICDDAGALIFTPADIDALGRKNGAAIHRLFSVASRLNGIGQAAIVQAEKNSDAGASNTGGTSSPANSA